MLIKPIEMDSIESISKKDRKMIQYAYRLLLSTVFIFGGLSLVSARTSIEYDLTSDNLEIQALRDLYNNTSGPNWTNSTGWPSTETEWDAITSIDQVIGWYGMTVANGDITEVQLPANNLTGSIPASLANLDALELLYLHGNNLTGGIPDLSSLTLKELILSKNDLGGTIPGWITGMTSLEKLILEQCGLTGEIPSDIGNLTNLHTLIFFNNQLTGSLPNSLGNLINLEKVRLHVNNFIGSIPPEIGNLTDLTQLELNRNQLSGSVPQTINNLNNLQTLSLYNNNLTGEFPSLSNTNINTLYIHTNAFSGRLPELPGSIEFVYAYKNEFDAVPPSYTQLNKLVRLFIERNKFKSIPSFLNSPNEASLRLSVGRNYLSFDAIENNLIEVDSYPYEAFVYTPQLDPSKTIEIAAGGDRTILNDRAGGDHTIYQWQKWNGSAWINVGSATSEADYQTSGAVIGDKFRCEMTNSWATDVTIYSSTFEVVEALSDTPDDFALTPLYNGNITAMKWHTAQPEGTTEGPYEGIYLFDYDKKYQLEEAVWGVDAGGGVLTNTNKYRLTGLTYDANGNIKTLQRYDQWSNRIHDFNYDYNLDANGEPNQNAQQNNQLQGIEGYAQYHYNSIGQLEEEIKEDGQHKYVEYDVTGKVTAVYADEDKTELKVSYTYDDRGFRLSALNEETGIKTWYIRDASGNVMSIYEEQVDEGTLAQTEVPVYGSGKVGVYYPQQDGSTAYELTDHLGNVRAVVKRNRVTFTATMEDTGGEEYTNPRVEEMQYFQNLFTSEMTNLPEGLNHTGVEVVANPKTAAYLTGAGDRIIGPAITLSVGAGDKIDLSAFAKFEEQESYGAPLALADIVGALTGTYVGFNGQEAATVLDDIFTGALTGFANAGDDTKPQAYLNYIFFDTEFNVLEKHKERVSEAAGFVTGTDPVDTDWHEFESQLEISENGYLYVYVSNHTPNSHVYFDDISITLTQKIVTQATDYYPGGSVARRANTPNSYFDLKPSGDKDFGKYYRYGYQGQYAMEDVETGWNSFELRMYDPTILRWTTTDPYSEYYSPYLAMGNNPINLKDPDGGRTCDTCPDDAKYDKYRNSNLDYAYSDLVGGDGVYQMLQEVTITANPLLVSMDRTSEQFMQGFMDRVSFLPGPWSVVAGIYQASNDAADGNYVMAGISLITLGKGGKVMKAANPALKKILPAWKKVKIDIDHIVTGHTSTGARAVQSGKKTVFQGMNSKQIEKTVRNAYKNVHTKLKTQGDRILVHGDSNGMTVEMWINKSTKTIETAYPIY